MFHIGITIPKKPKGKKKFLRPRYKLSSLEKSKLKPFEAYTGPRWQIPSGLKVSDEVRNTFQFFETIPAPQVFVSIATRLKQISISKCFLNTRAVQDWNTLGIHVYSTWKPPASITATIQRYNANQENILKRVKKIYMDLYKFTKQIKKLVHCHRIFKSLRNVKNTYDPVTLDVPVKAVYVLDYAKSLCYVYEASTLRKTIENRILFSEYMFPEPKPPVNLLSNEPYTCGQLFSIIDACRAHGEFSWILDRFKKVCECDLRRFEKRFKQDIKIEAIHTYFNSQKDYAKDTVIDYFESYAYSLGLDDNVIENFTNLYTKYLVKNIGYFYINQWISVTKRYYIASEMKDILELSRINMESSILIRKAEKVFGI